LTAGRSVRLISEMGHSSFAVIADVHGNAWALEAVLRDIAARGLTNIVNLGDNANGPIDPARSIELLRASGAIHVRGNGDRMTGEGGALARGSAKFARERLDIAALRWLRELPAVVRGDGWMAFHATLRTDEEYFLENVVAGKTVLASSIEILARLGEADANLVLCGHTHIPRLVRLGGRTIVNPGSVGLPAYVDNDAPQHVVETGSPDARYAILRRDASDWRVEFVCVPYDWTAAAAAARAAGWEDWARNVETGYA
jgi:predicted phosphodiesterase